MTVKACLHCFVMTVQNLITLPCNDSKSLFTLLCNDSTKPNYAAL